MKTNKEALKKHHFWILFGLVPLFVLIAVLVVSAKVGGAISDRLAEIKKEEDAIKTKTNPKQDVLLGKMEESIKRIDAKQDVLWKDNYVPQRNLYTMLDSPALKPLERLGLKFGDKIPNNKDQYDDFMRDEYYKARFEKMEALVRPTAFSNGWDKVLRHVNTWKDVKTPTSEQVWLLLEDIWVQESLLDAVAFVNAQMAEFNRVKFERDGQVIDDPADKAHQHPLRRKFRSRTWDIELEAVEDTNKRYFLKGTLINTTDRLQLMGVGNTMVLKVWLKPGDKKTFDPFLLKIGGEFLPGEGVTKVVKDKDGVNQSVPANVLHISRSELIPPGFEVGEIAYVEQVFDSRTVPIRLVQQLELGCRDSRNSEVALKQPKFFPEEAPAAEAAGPGPGGPGGPGPGGPPGRGSNQGMPGAKGGKEASAQQTFGGGTLASVIDGNKKRYLEVSDQVRRMPIGISLVVDQSYLQDVLVAFANSPLRFQITQVDWSRFRGSLGTEGESGSGRPNTGGGVSMSGSGQFGDGLKLGSGAGRPRPGPGPGSPPNGVPMGPGPGFNPNGGYMGESSGFTVSESQLTSGLIDLRVFGIVSLYTSPETTPPPTTSTPPNTSTDPNADPKKDPNTDPKKDKEPKEPKDKEPKGKEPMPKTPMPTDPKTGTEPKGKM